MLTSGMMQHSETGFLIISNAMNQRPTSGERDLSNEAAIETQN